MRIHPRCGCRFHRKCCRIRIFCRLRLDILRLLFRSLRHRRLSSLVLLSSLCFFLLRRRFNCLFRSFLFRLNSLFRCRRIFRTILRGRCIRRICHCRVLIFRSIFRRSRNVCLRGFLRLFLFRGRFGLGRLGGFCFRCGGLLLFFFRSFLLGLGRLRSLRRRRFRGFRRCRFRGFRRRRFSLLCRRGCFGCLRFRRSSFRFRSVSHHRRGQQHDCRQQNRQQLSNASFHSSSLHKFLSRLPWRRKKTCFVKKQVAEILWSHAGWVGVCFLRKHIRFSAGFLTHSSTLLPRLLAVAMASAAACCLQ